jgi:spermidine synthase
MSQQPRQYFFLLTVLLSLHLTLPSYAATLQDEIYREKSLYRDVVVTEKNDKRCMSFGRYARMKQTCITPSNPNKLSLDYTKLLLGSLYINPQPKKVLVLGLGGGIIPSVLQKLYPGLHLDLVEIDPAVTRVAAKYFNFIPNADTYVHTFDGRFFVKKAIKQNLQYDLIYIDVFDENYIPEHLLTVEFLREIKELLTSNGVVAINTFSNSKLYDAESATFAAGLGNFMVLKKDNRIILYKKSGLPAMEELKIAANQMQSYLDQFGIDKDWMLSSMSTKIEWNTKTKVFTDQFSPVNLFNK